MVDNMFCIQKTFLFFSIDDSPKYEKSVIVLHCIQKKQMFLHIHVFTKWILSIKIYLNPQMYSNIPVGLQWLMQNRLITPEATNVCTQHSSLQNFACSHENDSHRLKLHHAEVENGGTRHTPSSHHSPRSIFDSHIDFRAIFVILRQNDQFEIFAILFHQLF